MYNTRIYTRQRTYLLERGHYIRIHVYTYNNICTFKFDCRTSQKNYNMKVNAPVSCGIIRAEIHLY